MLIGLAVVSVILVVFIFAAGRCRQMTRRSLYDRIGGVYVISAIVDRFSDLLMESPITGKKSSNLALANWTQNQAPSRIPGLKFMRTLWICDVAGGPYRYHASNRRGMCLREVHAQFNISPEEFDEATRIFTRVLNEFNVPAAEKEEMIAILPWHKPIIVRRG